MTWLNTKRRERWTETIESINFTHSSRRAWQTIYKLTGQIKQKHYPITADSIAAQLISNGRFLNADKECTRKTINEVNELCRAPSDDANLSGDFTRDEMKSAIKHLKPNKATTSTRSSFCTRVVRPQSGFDRSAPSAFSRPSSRRYGDEPRSSFSRSPTSRWRTQRDTAPSPYSACHTRSWNVSSMRVLNR